MRPKKLQRPEHLVKLTEGLRFIRRKSGLKAYSDGLGPSKYFGSLCIAGASINLLDISVDLRSGQHDLVFRLYVLTCHLIILNKAASVEWILPGVIGDPNGIKVEKK